MSNGKQDDGAGQAAFDPGASEFVPKPRPPPINTQYSGGRPAPVQQPVLPIGAYFADRHVASPGTSLFPTAAWSPAAAAGFRVTQSASMPPKMSLDNFLNQPHAGQNFNAPLGGLGMGRGEFNLHRSGDRVAGATVQTAGQNSTYAQSKAYHLSGNQAQPVHSTFPLPQHPFGSGRARADQPRASPNANSPFGPSSVGNNATYFTQPPPVTTSSSFSPGSDGPGSGSQGKASSNNSLVISDHYSQRNPEQDGASGEVWTERPHARGLRRAIQELDTDWIEAYTGALDMLKQMNPEQYQMPYGSRVVNIKTESLGNLIYSFRCGKWSVLEKVSERIMQVWDARRDLSEKVLFLFSINGSKKFCGIAEVTGAWRPEDSLSGWQESRGSGALCVGTFPITWIYVKDIPYHTFDHIRQPKNGHPVGNMWNGMNFPSDIGRRVIECFVEAPAVFSILATPKGSYAQDMLQLALVSNAPNDGAIQRNELRPSINSPAFRGGRDGNRGSSIMDAPSWRPQQAPTRAEEDPVDEERTPTAQRPRPALNVNVSVAGSPLKPDFTAPKKTALRPGQIVSAVVDENGNLVPINVGEPQKPLVRTTSDQQQRQPISDPAAAILPEYLREFSPASVAAAHNLTSASPPSGSFRSGSYNEHEHTQGVFAFSPEHVRSQAGPNQGSPHAQPGSGGSFLRPAASMSSFRVGGSQGSLPHGGPVLQQRPSMPYLPQPQGHLPQSEGRVRALFPEPYAQYPGQPLGTTYTRVEGENRTITKVPRGWAPQLGEETPTHRPYGKKPASASSSFSPAEDMSGSWNPELAALQRQIELKAEYHSLNSQQFAIEREMVDQSHAEITKAMLREKHARVVAAKQEVEAALANLGPTGYKFPISTPGRQSSGDSYGMASNSSIEKYNISPVKASDGRVLKSASKHGSPPYQLSGRQRTPNGNYTPTWKMLIQNNSSKLSTSPEHDKSDGVPIEDSPTLGRALERPGTADSAMSFASQMSGFGGVRVDG